MKKAVKKNEADEVTKKSKKIKNPSEKEIIEQARKFRCTKCGDEINEDLNILGRETDDLQVGVWCNNCIKTIDESEPHCCYRTISKEEYIEEITSRRKYRLLSEFTDTIESHIAFLHYYEGVPKSEIIEDMFHEIERLIIGYPIHRTESEMPKSLHEQAE